MFSEKNMEWSPKQGKDIPVWQSPKYLQSKAKAIDAMQTYPFLGEGDFWILMNETKTGKMAYSGLIISHNACLKINDNLPATDKFKPECVAENQNGYRDSLVYTYCCPEQGLFEVGEVNAKNCKNEYPYAMAFKRLFDRVVLKQCKLAYDGIYSDSEADEFRNNDDAPAAANPGPQDAAVCADCGTLIVDSKKRDGSEWTATDITGYSLRRFGRVLCPVCQRKAFEEGQNG